MTNNRGGASFNPSDSLRSFEIKSNDGKDKLIVNSYHLSCRSDVAPGKNWNMDVNFGGIIIYSLGNLKKENKSFLANQPRIVKNITQLMLLCVEK